MRDTIGRILCFALGALYAAGLVRLFTFGERGKQIWQLFENAATSLATQFGIPEFVAQLGLGSLTFAGPLALVWFIAGPGITRLFWLALGAIAFGTFSIYVGA